MFGLFKKAVESEFYAPVQGEMIPLEKVKDPVFAEKMMGDGCAFVYEGDTVCAPCKGEIILLADTGHAFGIRAENGTEILIHIGLDTVNLNGAGFEMLVKEHTRVKVHDPIIRLDRKLMKEKNIDLTTPMVVTNLDDFELTLNAYGMAELTNVVFKTGKK